jgi:MFS family permease
MSLMVFDETGSTLLSALLFIAGMIPSVVLPILIAPLIDRYPKKRIIVGLDYLMGILFLFIAYVVSITGFKYSLYLFFSLITGIID